MGDVGKKKRKSGDIEVEGHNARPQRSRIVTDRFIPYNDKELARYLQKSEETNLGTRVDKSYFVNGINKTKTLASGECVVIPRTFKQAMNTLQAKQWLAAIKEEWEALERNGTWKFKEIPKGIKPLRTQFIFDLKLNSDSTIERYKARLVVMGNYQIYGIDYAEVFAPVVRYETLRLLLAIACAEGYEVHQVDISTAFLNGILEEEIFIQLPEGAAVEPNNKQLGCKLEKSLYGLKQAPRVWYNLLNKVLFSLGFTRCNKDYCIYVKRWGDNVIFIGVYVDDLTIVGNNVKNITHIKRELSKQFKMRDLGEIHFILKMEIKRNRNKKLLSINQSKYINEIILKYLSKDAKIALTPESNIVLTKGNLVKENNLLNFDYRGLVGMLMHLVRGTRPDIANAVRELSKFLNCYNETHWLAAKRVLRYLKGTSNYGLLYDGKSSQSGNPEYMLFTDASFGNIEDRKSVTGYVSLLCNGAVTWRSCKQDCISISTAEAEIVAVSEGTKESEWLWFTLHELGF